MRQIFLSKNKAKQLLDSYSITIHTNFLYFIVKNSDGKDIEVNIILNDQNVMKDYVETFKKEGYYENQLAFYPAPTIQELGNAMTELFGKEFIKSHVRKKVNKDNDFLKVIWDIDIMGDVLLELLEMDKSLIQYENKVLEDKLNNYNGKTDD